MGDDDRIAQLALQIQELKQRDSAQTEQFADALERLTKLETRMEMQHQLIVAEITGYVKGQLDSVNGNIDAVARELLRKLAEHEKEGGQQVTKITVVLAGILAFSAVAAALLATLLAERFGFITRLPGP